MGNSDIETYNEKGLAPVDSYGQAQELPHNNGGGDKKGDLWVDDVKVVAADENDLENAAHNFGIHATADELAEAEEKVGGMSLEKCKKVMGEVLLMHQHDQNFSTDLVTKIKQLLYDPDVTEHPERHASLIHAMKLEAVMATENSPYEIVRGVVDNFDDPSIPSLTFRTWFIGMLFAGLIGFVNQLFSIRYPSIAISAYVGQLVAFPLGKLLEKIMPRKQFNTFGWRWSFNPGPFNRKEHMLITIMCTIVQNPPYTGNIILAQALPIYFNQPFARTFGYQLCNTLASNFLGLGMAGIFRRFIVYPSFCVWPVQLATLALNKAFHMDDSAAVSGPFKRFYYISRMKMFYWVFGIYFVWFWFPNFIAPFLNTFDWMAWIAPNNRDYVAMVAVGGAGLGLNPFPTFDWSQAQAILSTLTVPLFSVTNQLIGVFLAMFPIIALWYTNTWQTGRFPILDNHTFNNVGKRYNVTMVTDSMGKLVEEKYQAYSEPWMAASNLMIYFMFFAGYSSVVTYTILYHRHEMKMAFTQSWASFKRSLKKNKHEDEDDVNLAEDVHMRLMRAYPEVPEWWYLIIFLIAFAVGIVGLAAFPTGVSPAIVLFGVVLAIIFTIPTGLVTAVTGGNITLNVLAEFIGGALVPGDALAMNYFKMYGYIVSAYAINFCGDLKLAHYTKINPRHTFVTQMAATLLASFVACAIFNFQMSFKDVCTPEAEWGMICPGENTFFTAALFFGLTGPRRMFGTGGRYMLLLLGFPIGVAVTIAVYFIQRAYPKNKYIRALHPVMIFYGPLNFWSAPYNLSHIWISWFWTWVSWGYVKNRWLAFWNKYNFVFAASLNCSIAIAALVMFFCVQVPGGVMPEWWGVTVGDTVTKPILVKGLPEKGYFGPDKGTFN